VIVSEYGEPTLPAASATGVAVAVRAGYTTTEYEGVIVPSLSLAVSENGNVPADVGVPTRSSGSDIADSLVNVSRLSTVPGGGNPAARVNM
jgi:hypothetical protein